MPQEQIEGSGPALVSREQGTMRRHLSGLGIPVSECVMVSAKLHGQGS